MQDDLSLFLRISLIKSARVGLCEIKRVISHIAISSLRFIGLLQFHVVQLE